MMKIIVSFCLLWSVCIFSPELSPAQSTQYIKGKISDSTTGSNILHAPVFLLCHKDTIARTYSDETGGFLFAINKRTDTLLLVADHPRYFPYRKRIPSAAGTTNLGTLMMEPVPFELKEVVIAGHHSSDADTTKIKADSFSIRRYANAQELLRRIPGMQIGAGGNITYNGALISGITIDGVPFLSFDQTRLLQLVRGKDIDILRIYADHAQADPANSDPVNSPKRMDIVLKEEAKHGYYGKIGAGVGFDKNNMKWDNNSDLSSFTNDHRITAFVHANNTGNSNATDETIPPVEPENMRGLSKDIEAGLHYDRSLFHDKRWSLNINSTIRKSTQNISSSTSSQYLLPEGIMTSQAVSSSQNNSVTGNVSLETRYRFDADAYLSISVSTSLGQSAFAGMNTGMYTTNDTVVNKSFGSYNMKSNSQFAFFNITYNKSFSKPGRSLTVTLAPNLLLTNSENNQKAVIQNADTIAAQNIDQLKQDQQATHSYLFSVNYTEPLKKNIGFSVDLQSAYSNTVADTKTFDRYTDADHGFRDTLNPLYSNNYRFENITNKLSPAFNGKFNKLTVSLGLEMNYLIREQANISSATRSTNTFTNFLPFFTTSTGIRNGGHVSFQYRLSATQPGMTQLQPIVNNSDPLHQLIGNPDLKQAMTHNFGLSFSKNRPRKNEYYSVSANVLFTSNAIILKQNFNAAGQEFSQYYNQDGNFSGNITGNYNLQLYKRLQLMLNGSYAVSRTNSLVNAVSDLSVMRQYAAGCSFRYSVDTQLTISYEPAFSYSTSHFVVNAQTKNNLFNVKNTLNINYSLPWGITLATYVNWHLISGMGSEHLNIILCNAYIERYLRKDGVASVRLFAYDLFNQNKGFVFYNENNVITETTSNTVSRYLMLSFIWNFTRR